MKEYNGAMMQFFHWHTPTDVALWKQLAEQSNGDWMAEDCAERTLSAQRSRHGVAALLPNPFKGAAGIVALRDGFPVRARGYRVSADLAVTGFLAVTRRAKE